MDKLINVSERDMAIDACRAIVKDIPEEIMKTKRAIRIAGHSAQDDVVLVLVSTDKNAKEIIDNFMKISDFVTIEETTRWFSFGAAAFPVFVTVVERETIYEALHEIDLVAEAELRAMMVLSLVVIDSGIAAVFPA